MPDEAATSPESAPESQPTGEAGGSTTPDFENNPLGEDSPQAAPESEATEVQPSVEGEAPAQEEGESTSEAEETTPVDEEGSSFEWTPEVYKALGFKEVDGEYYALHGEDEAGNPIVYKGIEDIRKGAQEKQKHIVRQDRQLAELQKKFNEVQQRLDSKERDLTLFNQRITDEQLDELYTEKYRAEELGELAEKSLEDMSDEEKAQFEKATINAKARVIREREKLQEEQERQESTLKQRMNAATDFYKEKVKAKRFGVKNSEEKSALTEFLLQPSGSKDESGKSYPQSQMIYNLAIEDPQVAEVYIDGLKSRFWSQYSGSPENSKPKEERVYNAGEKPKGSKPAPTPAKMTSREMMSRGLRAQVKGGVV